MNARTLLNIGLALAVVAAVVLYLRPAPPSRESSFPLLEQSANALRSIEITRREADAITLTRNTEVWRMTAPISARLDDLALARVLELARHESATRMRATDLARFGLDTPWARIRFDSEMIELGSSNELTRELYVKRGEFVFTAPARLAAAVPAAAAKLIAHRLFGANEAPVAFRLAKFAVRNDGVRWQLDPPDPSLSQDDLVRWSDQWRLASSVLTQPHTGSRVGESIQVELRDGRVIEVKVLARAPDLVLLRGDESLDYHLPARFADLLLAPPNAVPTSKR